MGPLDILSISYVIVEPKLGFRYIRQYRNLKNLYSPRVRALALPYGIHLILS